METVLLEAATLLAAELAAGALVLGGVLHLAARRGDRLRWRLGASESLRAVIPAAVFVVVGILLVSGSSERIDSMMTLCGRWVLFMLSGSLAAAGAWLLLEAGRYEARGKLDEAWFLARTGGFWLAGSAPVEAAVGAWILTATHAPTGFAAAVVLAGLGASLAGLLAGLSGKPRPTGWAAAILAVACVFLLACALGRAGRFVSDAASNLAPTGDGGVSSPVSHRCPAFPDHSGKIP